MLLIENSVVMDPDQDPHWFQSTQWLYIDYEIAPPDWLKTYKQHKKYSL